MASETGNPFAGHWQDGVGLVERRNPSDISEVTGQYGQANAVDAACGARPELRAAGIRIGPVTGADRLDQNLTHIRVQHSEGALTIDRRHRWAFHGPDDVCGCHQKDAD